MANSKSYIMTTFIPAKGSKELKCRQDKIDDNLPVVIKKKKTWFAFRFNKNWSSTYDSLFVICMIFEKKILMSGLITLKTLMDICRL